VKVLVMIDIAIGLSIDPPTACSIRNATSQPSPATYVVQQLAKGGDAMSGTSGQYRFRGSRHDPFGRKVS
jgi:hypothetical protein